MLGVGQITARLHGTTIVFPQLSYTYPLKLLSPRIDQDGVAIVYMLSYGGGLVGGDHIVLAVDVGSGVHLLLLSQGSTKVFKARPGSRVSVRYNPETTLREGDLATTRQRLDVHIADGGALFLLPDPVTCFQAASYHQIQTFHLENGASAVLLDWYTSGRRARGEEWAFSQYRSINEVFLDGTRIARDAVLLDGEPLNVWPLPRRTLADKMGPYSCFATVMLYGPLVKDLVRGLDVRFKALTVFKITEPPVLLWSLSPIRGQDGRMLRVAGKETEDVRVWLQAALQGLENIVGIDIYRKAFA
ncbi:UreD-domain-containing protein [Amylostereum chailletii]|nr:UreD-domain-containing protein [Amylostereum chailletii]